MVMMGRVGGAVQELVDSRLWRSTRASLKGPGNCIKVSRWSVCQDHWLLSSLAAPQNSPAFVLSWYQAKRLARATAVLCGLTNGPHFVSGLTSNLAICKRLKLKLSLATY
jgi:hypothetical protein